MNVLVAHSKVRYTSVHQLCEAELTETVLEKLADADAFRSMGYDRRNALWEVATKDHQSQALINEKHTPEMKVELLRMKLSEQVMHDYLSTSLSLKAHPVSFIRTQLEQLHVRSAASLESARNGELVKVAGLILVRQRPGTASGICFITIEDETGVANLVVFKNLFDEIARNHSVQTAHGRSSCNEKEK